MNKILIIITKQPTLAEQLQRLIEIAMLIITKSFSYFQLRLQYKTRVQQTRKSDKCKRGD